ncbi:gamma-glutamyl-gamma-aminobutyrate hydrolase family protein [Paenibacillus polymyxa]|uniref:gamma-glutamyl-gamma-aminobutyrate hydrolase family protein n=1 Tax=Paenibacillus polymyxa TaxID=1406 RepID=UPI000FB379E6|nr:gamma-glutamyl-gamma-aminobutyrate hydrolase family protein [Paenibacillus sp. EKM208P]
MTLIAVTQRVDKVEAYQERRNSLDQRWITFLEACHCLPLILPNNKNTVHFLLQEVQVSGILLTGGGDLESLGGQTPERDEVENRLIQYAIQNQIPLLGICRGMQVIQHYFGVQLYKIIGHDGQEHDISWGNKEVRRNSFHNYGTRDSCDGLEKMAWADDGVIEAVRHLDYPICGLMWHPERNTPFNLRDVEFITHFFKTGDFFSECFSSSL